MAEKKKGADMPVADDHGISVELLITKLETLIEESGSIADYICENVQYGRALGYAEGKFNAYIELLDRVIGGEFDNDVQEGR